MRTRTLTIGSFFSIAMAATLVGALVTSQARRPEPVAASSVEAPQARAAAAPLGLDTFRDIARTINPGVVNINTSKTVRLRRNPFHDFFGLQDDDNGQSPVPDNDRGGERRTRTSLGSGFVIDDQGYILTNRHVIEGADEISISFPDGKRYEAKVVGQDARTDVALVKIEPKGKLTPIPLGNSDGVEAGEWVMAVGNPFGLGGQQRDGRRRVVQGPRPGARRAQHVGRHDPDRRRDQPRQLRRSADQRARRGGRHQHDDRHRRRAGERGRRLLRPDQRGTRDPVRSCARRARSRAAGWASRSAR